MPAVVCHWIFGKRLEDFAGKLNGEKYFDVESFLLGCQGPDILFYHRLVSFSRKRSLARFGSPVHRYSPSQLFFSLKKTLAKYEPDGDKYIHALSYALGMCCHYAYDACAHPYICQLEEYMKQADERGADYHYHAHIESALDVIMLRHETGQLITDLRLGRCVKFSRCGSEVIADIYGNFLHDVYGVSTDYRNLCRLAPDMRRLFRVLDDPTTLWRPTVRKLEILAGKDSAPMSAYMRPFMEDDSYDYANIEKEEWRNTDKLDEVSCEDFFEITQRAEELAREMMQLFLSAESIGDFERFES